MPKKPTKDPTGRIWPADEVARRGQAIPLKIELTGHASEPGGDSIVMLIEVLRTIAKDFGVTIDYPAMIYLDDLEEAPDPSHPQGVREARGGYDEVARRGQALWR